MLGNNGWHVNKEDFCGSQGKVKDVDKDKEELINPSPVSHSPMHVHLHVRHKNYFCQYLFLFPIKQIPLMFQAHLGSTQGRCPEGLNELSFPFSSGWDVTGSHLRGRAEPHLSSPPCMREFASYIKNREMNRLGS